MQNSKKMLWTGRFVSGLTVLFMLFAAIVKLRPSPELIQGFQQYGYPGALVVTVGIIELVCTLVYLLPSTRVLGAILLTGVLGGATATNVRVDQPTWILPVVLGVLVWLGLFLRDERLRALLPVRD
ncbi:MAG TPA: DoxX family protein [Bryobacteraceae bacterium]|jgi:hypothetical protein